MPANTDQHMGQLKKVPVTDMFGGARLLAVGKISYGGHAFNEDVSVLSNLNRRIWRLIPFASCSYIAQNTFGRSRGTTMIEGFCLS